MFTRAVKRQAKLKLAIAGPSGSGKTMSALRMAQAIGKKIALIDTENGSASLYADRFQFDVAILEPPFTTDKYIAAIEAAERSGYDVIIIDSASHAWAGEGGTLDKKAALDARGGNNYTNWRGPKADYTKLKNAFLHSSAHIICTIRSKQAYAIVDDSGKSKVQKLGLDPIAEPGIEYEFTVVFDVAADHKAQASKDRTSLFADKVFQITEKTGEELVTWLNSGAPQIESPKSEPRGSGVHCDACGEQLILAKSKVGYLCPKSTDKNDGHTRFVVGRLDEMKKREEQKGNNGHGPNSDAVL